MKELRRLFDAGQLNPIAAHYFSKTKPVEELYDTVRDPHEVHNLALDPEYQDTLKRMRAAHLKWVTQTRDLGLVPEPILLEREKTPRAPIWNPAPERRCRRRRSNRPSGRTGQYH